VSASPFRGSTAVCLTLAAELGQRSEGVLLVDANDHDGLLSSMFRTSLRGAHTDAPPETPRAAPNASTFQRMPTDVDGVEVVMLTEDRALHRRDVTRLTELLQSGAEHSDSSAVRTSEADSAGQQRTPPSEEHSATLGAMPHNVDVLIVDAGPVLFSAYASELCLSADCVVLVMPSRQRLEMLSATSTALDAVKAPVLAVTIRLQEGSHGRRSSQDDGLSRSRMNPAGT
jgi:Mrp family chromosome partitioning ATPase